MSILEEIFNEKYFELLPDYSCTNDFWDNKNKRSLSKEQAVAEGYFNSIDEAIEYLNELGRFED